MTRRWVWVLVAGWLAASEACGDNAPARHEDDGSRDAPQEAASDTPDVAPDVADAPDGGADGVIDGDLDRPDAGDGATDGDAGDVADAAPDIASDVSASDRLDTPIGDGPDASGDGSFDRDSGDGGNDAGSIECAITMPSLGVMHPMLNGVPVAQGGDRISGAGQPYAVLFEITTNLADNQLVELTVDDVATPSQTTVYTAPVANGRARFAAVTLPTDGLYEARARCLDDGGLSATSARKMYEVDTTPPELTVSSPQDNEFIPPAGLTDGAFPVCGGTTSEDAVNLDPALGVRSANGCISAGGSPTCFAVPVTATQGCLPVACPGDAPFDVVVTLGDVAGNVQQKIVHNVSCFSTLPSVQIVAPVSDAPTFSDPSKRLLAATAPQLLRDNGGAAGAQTDVVACANRAGTIALFTGHKGDAMLAAIGVPRPTRAAVMTDHCPANFNFAVTFAGVTLPESVEAADTSLVSATELRADLVDQSAAKNSSPVVDLWVDSVAPSLVITAPTDICNSYHQSNDIYTSTETVTSTAPHVELTLTNSDSTQNFSSETFTTLTFPFVVFTQGVTSLGGQVRDGAGNVSLLQPNPCFVTVGPDPK